MKFDTEYLIDLVGGEYPDDEIEDEIIDNGRWSIYYRMIFKHEGKFYETFYSRGATEQQDEHPYDNEDDEIECDEVIPIEKIITVYKRK